MLNENKLKFTNVFRNKEDIINQIVLIRKDFESHKNLIDKIIMLRDKVCAHTDSVPGVTRISHEELESIVIMANNIYNTLFGKIFDSYFDLSRTSDWDLRYIIKKLPSIYDSQ